MPRSGLVRSLPLDRHPGLDTLRVLAPFWPEERHPMAAYPADIDRGDRQKPGYLGLGQSL